MSIYNYRLYHQQQLFKQTLTTNTIQILKHMKTKTVSDIRLYTLTQNIIIKFSI
ncbi:hypothetical protein OENI_50042 [Oenococcus oeni]|nr:hypothetical protein OENI_50042 [Oenococcus oeni]